MFKLGDKLTAENYAAAAKWCNESLEYMIDNYMIVKIPEPTFDEKAAIKRSQRDLYLSETDKYMISDFPISDEKREQYRQYRQYLRDIPARLDFPNLNICSFSEWSNND